MCLLVILDSWGPAGVLWFICIDKAQGYHQIGVKHGDREKLAFFGPDSLKYTFKVLPFGPTNTPSFYTAMIRQFQDEWTLLFRLECNRQNIEYNHKHTSQPASICRNLPLTDNYEESCVTASMPNLEVDEEFTLESDVAPFLTDSVKTIPIGGGDVVVRQKMAKSDRHHVTSSSTIIDDIVGWSTSKALVLLLFECMCRAFG